MKVPLYSPAQCMLRADVTVSGVSAGGHAEHFGGFIGTIRRIESRQCCRSSRLTGSGSHQGAVRGFPLPLRGRHARITQYLAGNTTRRGHSLAGYQLLWEALPIASREETTVKAQ
jgi:hypothetical protein